MGKRSSGKREKLIQSAFDLAKERGSLQQLTLREIAENGGVPLGNVYFYFKTKDQLLTTMISTISDNLYQSTKLLTTNELLETRLNTEIELFNRGKLNV